MFWENFISLCSKTNKSPTAVIKELGISGGSVTNWKNGKVPHQTTLIKLADYFGVTVDYLLGNSDQRIPAVASEIEISPHEWSVLSAYRSNPDMQGAVDKLLGVEK